MTIDSIAREAEKLFKKYGERDPFRLAEALGIRTELRPMGLYDGCVKGFFIYAYRIRHITVNSDLPELLQRVIMAHELGHAVLHAREAGVSGFHDMLLFDSTVPTEYEANLFASEILLEDEAVMEALNEDGFFFQAAGKLCVPPELLDFKFRVMKRRGWKLESPLLSQSNFLKDIEKLDYQRR